MARGLLTVGPMILLVLAGCGGATSDEPGGQPAGAAVVTCGGSVYDAEALDDAPGVEALPEGPADAVDDAGQAAFDPHQGWRVVHRAEDRVDLVRELEAPFDNGGGDIRTHESRTLERIRGAPNVPDGTWLLTSAGPCAQRRLASDDLGDADLTLPRTPPPEATTVDLLVHERACASGQQAHGRIELVELVETDRQIRLHVRVRPRPGGQDCQGNPPTPFTVELDGPVGDREIVDGSVVPARPVPLHETAEPPPDDG